MVQFRSFVVAAAVVCVGVGAAGAADDRCAATKLGAAGKAAKSALTCVVNELKKPSFDEVACRTKFEEKLTKDFTKAEGFGACTGSAGGCSFVADACAAAVAAAAEPPATAEGCRSTLLKAASKYAQAILKCDSGFYKGGDLTTVGECRAKALAKLNKLFIKTASKVGSCAPLTVSALAAVVDGACGSAVRADLPDTARICQVCCQTEKLGVPIGCAVGDAEVVSDGCDHAAAFFSALTDYTFAIDTGAAYCDAAAGACAATLPAPPEFYGCCQIDLDGEPACSQGAISLEALESCTGDFAGTVNAGYLCENGQTCIEVP